jgi:Rrf2 family protein
MRNAQSTPIRIPVLSQTGEHALRAVLYIARRPAGALVPAGEIATALGAPANYLSKTLRRLARRGILHSARGPHGGFALAVDPARLSTAEVVAAIDEPTGQARCLMGDGPCDAEYPCALHGRWSELALSVLRPLRETSIADLLDGIGETIPESEALVASR